MCKDKIREKLERQMIVSETKINVFKHCLTKRRRYNDRSLALGRGKTPISDCTSGHKMMQFDIASQNKSNNVIVHRNLIGSSSAFIKVV